MKRPVNISGSDGKKFTITIDKFNRGVMTLFDDTRLPVEAVAQAQNMYLDQDGVWSTRPGSQPYGATLTTPIDGGGSFTKYNTDNTITTYLWVVDNGSFKISQDGGSWTTKTGVTWTTGWPITGLQVAAVNSSGTRVNMLLLANGTNSLSYYDIDNGVLGSYSSISAPTGLAATRNGLSAGNYNVYYKVTAVNSIGETLASSEASVSGGIDKTRDNWTVGTHYITLDWNDVTGASRYNIYYSDRTGEEVYLDSVVVSQYTDTGEATPNPYQSVPDADSTAGNKYMDLAMSGNRIWGTKDPNLPYRVGWTGTGQYMGAFNPFYGGGYVDLEKGGSERPEKVVHFRTGKGDSVATVLTSDPNGNGSTWAIALSSLTVDTLTIVIPVVTKQQGSVGTRSPRGVVEYDNAFYFPSPKGFHNLGSRQSVLNVLMTKDLSDVIRPSIDGINNQYASSICGIAHNGRVYWSLPYGSTTNNQIWIFDLERRGTWSLPWSLGVKQFFKYTDTSGVIHLLAVPVTGTKLIELGSTAAGDSGTAYTTLLQSGLIHWDKNHMTWATINKAYIELADPYGTVNFTVTGTKRGSTSTITKTRTIQTSLAVSGFGADLYGNYQYGNSGSAGVTFSQPSVKKELKINKKLNNLYWQLSTSTIDARYTLMQVVIEGVLQPTTSPQEWKN